MQKYLKNILLHLNKMHLSSICILGAQRMYRDICITEYILKYPCPAMPGMNCCQQGKLAVSLKAYVATFLENR